MELTTQQSSELGYWREVITGMGNEKYLEFRTGQDAADKLFYFPDIYRELGKGIDYGCGVISIFEGKSLDMEAYDPLLEEYDKILKSNGGMKYHNDTSGIRDNSYDFAFCCNVLDHTPDPVKLLNDIHRIIRPMGKLYFEVHFDPVLSCPTHSMLWNEEVVKEYIKPDKFLLLRSSVFPGSYKGQRSYQAVYEVVK